MTEFAYYPGCSLEATSEAYDISVRAVCRVLDIGLAEIDDWNCCGATEAPTLQRVASYALVARNLARVDPSHDQVVAPCAACYLNLKKTDKLLGKHPELRKKVSAALAAGGLSYEPGRLQVRHLLDVVFSDFGVERLAACVSKPLHGLRVAPYYGCQFVRPNDGVDDAEHPVKLDKLLVAMGATVVESPLKSHCCGGHMTQISEQMCLELIRRLLDSADDFDADLIACLCPMCQLNLDAYQGRVNNAYNTDFELPAVFFTQLLGLALGIEPNELGFGSEIVAALPVIQRVVSNKPPGQDDKPRRRRRSSRSLPMPRTD